MAIAQNARSMRRAAFDRQGLCLLPAALQVHPPVSVSVTRLRQARQQIAPAAYVRQQELDDAISLACVVDGRADVLTSYKAVAQRQVSSSRANTSIHHGLSLCIPLPVCYTLDRLSPAKRGVRTDEHHG